MPMHPTVAEVALGFELFAVVVAGFNWLLQWQLDLNWLMQLDYLDCILDYIHILQGQLDLTWLLREKLRLILLLVLILLVRKN